MKWREALGCAGLLVSIYFGTFLLLGTTIHGSGPSVSLPSVNWWMLDDLLQFDGIEVPFMLGLTAILLTVAYLIGRADALRTTLWSGAGWFGLVVMGVLIGHTRTLIFSVPPDLGSAVATFLAMLCLLGLVALAQSRWTVRQQWIGGILLAGLVVLLIVFSIGDASVFDAGFFVGPALKLQQGEAIGTFFMQYGLLETLIFKWMMELGFRLNHMTMVLTGIFFVGFAMLAALSRALIRDRFVWICFFIAYVILRWDGSLGDLVSFPQTSPLRLELWVPIVFAIHRWGLHSWVTSTVVGIVYVADNLFGFSFFALYGLALAMTLWLDPTAVRYRRPAAILSFVAPALLGAALQIYLTGDVMSSAARYYQHLHLGFMVISTESMYWPIAALLAVATMSFGRESNPRRRTTELFLTAAVVLQLIYFFGRSHENNLLNIAGAWLLVVFTGIDSLIAQGESAGQMRAITALSVALCAAAALPGLGQRADRIVANATHGIFAEHPLDRQIDAAPNLFGNEHKVMLCHFTDAYWNYRYGFEQVGPVAPFALNLFSDETAALLMQKIKHGYRVVAVVADAKESDQVRRTVAQYNSTDVLQKRHLAFVIADYRQLLEVRLVHR